MISKELCRMNDCAGILEIQYTLYSIRTPRGEMKYPMYISKCNICGYYNGCPSNVTDEIIITISEYNGILWKNLTNSK